MPETYFLVIDLFYLQDFSIKAINGLLDIRQAREKMRLSIDGKKLKKLKKKKNKKMHKKKQLWKKKKKMQSE
ncbi:hypothetical protein ACEF17_10750 [Streptococcus hyovaginalis]